MMGRGFFIPFVWALCNAASAQFVFFQLFCVLHDRPKTRTKKGKQTQKGIKMKFFYLMVEEEEEEEARHKRSRISRLWCQSIERAKMVEDWDHRESREAQKKKENELEAAEA